MFDPLKTHSVPPYLVLRASALPQSAMIRKGYTITTRILIFTHIIRSWTTWSARSCWPPYDTKLRPAVAASNRNKHLPLSVR
ncbi:hypothetical protein MPL3356_110343 [Mesorhizobium plurifarium]|uniref:Uncharacterized protein n=1 Tax=Mesorhizobium plurifarium TaxID=69974 RepID=A0A090EYE1_MESPL|nr:hypothetical protein MPL3356_110343 [Mesorhizobium plurifarium]